MLSKHWLSLGIYDCMYVKVAKSWKVFLILIFKIMKKITDPNLTCKTEKKMVLKVTKFQKIFIISSHVQNNEKITVRQHVM